MGFAVDTESVFEFVLDADKGKPADARPTFLFRYPSLRDFKRIAALFAESESATDPDEMIAKATGGISHRLCGWRNMGTPYDPANLEAVITSADMWEMRNRLLGEMTISESEKKRLSSPFASNSAQSASVTAASAENAPPIPR